MKGRGGPLFWWGILLLAGVAFLMGTAAKFKKPVPDPNPSTLNPSPEGTKGWYVTLQRTGVPVARWTHPLSEWTASGTGTFVTMETTFSAWTRSAEYAQPLLAWVAQGHRWILINPRAAELVPGWTPSKDLVEGRIPLESVAHGKGTILIGLDATPYANRRLALSPKEDLMVRWRGFMDSPPPITFGEMTDHPSAAFTWPWEGPGARWVFWHLLTALVCWLMWSGRRIGRPRPVPVPRPAEFIRHVEAIGSFWHRFRVPLP